MLSMSWVDVLIILGCFASACLGVWRGFMKEVLSLITWLAAIWLAWRFTWVIEPALSQWVAAPELKLWFARSVIFIVDSAEVNREKLKGFGLAWESSVLLRKIWKKRLV